MRVTFSEIIKDLIAKRKAARNNPKAHFEAREIERPIVFCYNTINQREALKPLIAAFAEKAETIGENPDFFPNQPDVLYYHRLSLQYSVDLIRWYYTLKGYHKTVFRSRYYNFHLRLGQYRHLLSIFSKSKNLKYYIASNDHSGMSQVGFVAAKTAGIKTVYIQHASVSDKFPPLDVDYAFLEGEDAKAKYLAVGPTNAKIELIGTMKYDKYLQRGDLEKPGPLIGVCLGIICHDFDQNFALCEELTRLKKPFSLRFHPAVDQSIRKKFSESGWAISEPEDETALDFIMRCHTIVSGDSNILLEAIILKRRPLYFASDGEGLDYYGFLKAGILDSTHFRFELVLKALEDDFDIAAHRDQAKYFCDTINSTFEGRSTELAVQNLDLIIKS